MLGALALWAAVNKQWFWASLVALIAVETHPSAAVYCIYVAGIWLVISDLSKIDIYKNTALQVIPAALLGVGYYLILHYEHLGSLLEAVSGGSKGSFWKNSSLWQYFWALSWHKRYMLELLLFVLSYIAILFFYRDKDSRLQNILILFPILILLADIVLGRGSRNYIIHFYPPLIMLAVYAFSKVKFPVYLFPLLVSLSMLPQYAYWIYKNHDFYFPEYIARVHKHIDTHVEVAEADVVIGNYAQWFAFNDSKENSQRFVLERNTNILEKLEGKYVVWVNDYDRLKFLIITEKLGKIEETLSPCSMQELSSFDYGGHHVKFEAYDCRDKKITE